MKPPKKPRKPKPSATTRGVGRAVIGSTQNAKSAKRK